MIWNSSTWLFNNLFFSTRRPRHTHTTDPKITLQNTDYAHKTSQVISVKHVQYYLRMDPKGSVTCRSF